MIKVFNIFSFKVILEGVVLLLAGIVVYYSWTHVHKEMNTYDKDNRKESTITVDSIHAEIKLRISGYVTVKATNSLIGFVRRVMQSIYKTIINELLNIPIRRFSPNLERFNSCTKTICYERVC